MNNKQKQKANIAAAKLLGLEYSAKSIYKTNNGTWHIDMNLDIFTNPADCLAVVKKLGQYGLKLESNGSQRWLSFIQVLIGEYKPCCTHWMTYEEAVAAACLEIGGKDE